MKKNIGKTDSIIRFIVAIIIFAIGIYFKSWWGLLGLIPLFTGLIVYCALYSLLGINTTCTVKEKK